MARLYDRMGRPLSMDLWAATYDENHRVAQDVLPNGYWVSTVWLGIDHAFGGGPPLIFETMVFACDSGGHVTNWGECDSDRYATEEAAVDGHRRMVERWAAMESPAVTAE
jgi:hypothetical protein